MRRAVASRSPSAPAAFPRRRTVPRGLAARTGAPAPEVAASAAGVDRSPSRDDGRGGAMQSTPFAASATSSARCVQARVFHGRAARARPRRPSGNAARGGGFAARMDASAPKVAASRRALFVRRQRRRTLRRAVARHAGTRLPPRPHRTRHLGLAVRMDAAAPASVAAVNCSSSSADGRAARAISSPFAAPITSPYFKIFSGDYRIVLESYQECLYSKFANSSTGTGSVMPTPNALLLRPDSAELSRLLADENANERWSVCTQGARHSKI